MIGTARRFPGFPLRGLFLVALGFLLASLLGGGGSGLVGVLGLVLLPLLLVKMVAMFMLFGFALRFIGPRSASGRGWGPGPGGRGGWGHHHGRPTDGPGTDRADASAQQRDRADWDESLRWARTEVDRAERGDRGGHDDRPATGPAPGQDFPEPGPDQPRD